MSNKDIVVIADLQVSKGDSIEHIEALSRYLWKHKPDEVVNIGDTFDFPALSSYMTALEKEGKRLIDDLVAGYTGMDAIMAHVYEKNSTRKHRKYNPKLNFIEGNHENRLNRYITNHPELAGFIDLKYTVECKGWTYHNMGVPYWVNNVAFVHYLENPMSGRPIGGSIENKLNKMPHSFVHGHQQQYQFARRQNLKGMPHFGVCAGSFYIADEDYRGSNNTEIRGFVHMKHFINRYGFDDYDVEFVSLERLLAQY